MVTTLAFLATLVAPFGSSFRVAHALESVEPAGAPNFSDATNGVGAGRAATSATQAATKARSAPVDARGSFTHALAIQVPPGRLGMTPSLALRYDSASLVESPVGVGWSFDVGRISRSTRLGYPALTGLAFAPRYDAARALFTGPTGELAPSADGPSGAAGALFAPVREVAPVRYEFVSASDRWVEHDPSGTKKYYGADPFDGRAMRVVNELGTFSWLLLREEDPHGNFVTYDYHGASSQTRASRDTAQIAPIVSRIAWGGNRVTGQASPFVVTTQLEAHEGPLNVLDGNTLLTSRVTQIHVAVDGRTEWTYTLGYQTSAETGKALLVSFRRDEPAETTTFRYTSGAPAGARFAPMGPLHAGADDRFYTEGSYWYGGPFNEARPSFDSAVQAPGHRAGVKFVDIDGNGTTDAIYHAAGLGTTSTHILWEESRLQQPARIGLGGWSAPGLGDWTAPSLAAKTETSTGLPFFPLRGGFHRSDFTHAMVRELVDLDGDGDIDALSLPINLWPKNGRHVWSPLPPPHLSPTGDKLPLRGGDRRRDGERRAADRDAARGGPGVVARRGDGRRGLPRSGPYVRAISCMSLKSVLWPPFGLTLSRPG